DCGRTGWDAIAHHGKSVLQSKPHRVFRSSTVARERLLRKAAGIIGGGMKSKLFLLTACIAVFVLSAHLAAQQRGGQGQPAQPPPTPRAAAPIDLTGYWVSIVTEDWRYRMVTPAKGDFASVPLNPEGTRVGNLWDPAKDEAAGEQCKSYAAPAIMRVPGRVHITWDNDT